jgi:hypothetical protein
VKKNGLVRVADTSFRFFLVFLRKTPALGMRLQTPKAESTQAVKDAAQNA